MCVPYIIGLTLTFFSMHVFAGHETQYTQKKKNHLLSLITILDGTPSYEQFKDIRSRIDQTNECTQLLLLKREMIDTVENGLQESVKLCKDLKERVSLENLLHKTYAIAHRMPNFSHKVEVIPEIWRNIDKNAYSHKLKTIDKFNLLKIKSVELDTMQAFIKEVSELIKQYSTV